MPYRALTHNRVKSFLTVENATTQSQASARGLILTPQKNEAWISSY